MEWWLESFQDHLNPILGIDELSIDFQMLFMYFRIFIAVELFVLSILFAINRLQICRLTGELRQAIHL